MSDERYMEMALALAREAADRGETPVGCVIVDEATGEVVAGAANAARKELRVMLEEMFPRIRTPRWVGEPHYLVSNFIPAIKSMHIAFDVEK